MDVERQLCDLVEEDRAAVRELKEPLFPRAPRACERALDIAEQLALDERRRDGRAVHGDEGLLCSMACVVDALCHALLARARLTEDEDVRVCPREFLRARDDLLHALGLRADVGEADARVESLLVEGGAYLLLLLGDRLRLVEDEHRVLAAVAHPDGHHAKECLAPLDGHEPFARVLLELRTHDLGEIRVQAAAKEVVRLVVEKCGAILLVEHDNALVDVLDDCLEAFELQRLLAFCVEDFQCVVDRLLDGFLACIDVGVRDAHLLCHAHGIAAARDPVHLLRLCEAAHRRLDLLVRIAGADEDVQPREREVLRRLKEDVAAHDDGDAPHALRIEGGNGGEDVVERGCDLYDRAAGDLFDLLGDTAAADDDERVGVGEHHIAHGFVIRRDDGDIELAATYDALRLLGDIRRRCGKQNE